VGTGACDEGRSSNSRFRNRRGQFPASLTQSKSAATKAG
jgi:hypothetical protein